MTKSDYLSLLLVALGIYSFCVGAMNGSNTYTLTIAIIFALIGVGGGAFIQSQSKS
jgi:hypothetical protein